MKTTIYANYGLLGAEKRAVYSTIPGGEIYDELVVDIPDELYVGHNCFGEVLINAGGIMYQLHEVLRGDEKPYIHYFDGAHMVLRELLEVRA